MNDHLGTNQGSTGLHRRSEAHGHLYKPQLPASMTDFVQHVDSGDGGTLCLLQKGCIVAAGQAESNAHGIVIG